MQLILCSTEKYLGHQRTKIKLMWLANNPVSISAECPTGNWPHKCLFVTKTCNQVRYKLWQMNDHARHTTYDTRQMILNCKQGIRFVTIYNNDSSRVRYSSDYNWTNVTCFVEICQAILNLPWWQDTDVITARYAAHEISMISDTNVTFGNGTEHQNTRLFQLPVLVEQKFFQYW